MNEGMDTGDIILKEEVEIGEDETTGELWDRLSKIGAKLLVETIKQIENKTAPREKQGDNFSIAPMLNKDMAKINWEKQTANEIKNLVRGLNPIMGAYTFLNGKKIKLWNVKVEKIDEKQQKNFPNGTVILSDSKIGLKIKANGGIITVIEIQGENAKRMNVTDYLRGNSILEGAKFD